MQLQKQGTGKKHINIGNTTKEKECLRVFPTVIQIKGMIESISNSHSIKGMTESMSNIH